MTQTLDAQHLKAVMVGFRDLLVSHKEVINALNVYPVPDGDTGTNMALTIDSVVTALDSAEDLADVCHAISHGSLMGARGNSGVIMSQILRGLASTLATANESDGGDLGSSTDGTLSPLVPAGDENSDSDLAKLWAKALMVASDAAYGAVQRPVEGTILTVIRAVAEAANAAADSGEGLAVTIHAARDHGHDTLSRTPEMLDVLAKAGVVDAGGSGLMLLIDALLNQIDGSEVPTPGPVPRLDGFEAPAAQSDDVPTGGSIADLRYEVMFLLDASDATIDDFRDTWAAIGDSIVVVGGDGLWNCHIHTDHIGPAIEAGIAVGRPHQIRITDLLEELDHKESLFDPTAGGSSDIVVHSTDPSRCGAVAVGVGEGIKRIFASLGAKAMVLGGQSMNPSTQLLLEAVERVAADEVLLLPNNKNIIAVADQVDSQTTKTVKVVPTRSITEGFASLLEFDPESGAEQNRIAMTEAASAVLAGEVTRAVRPSTSDAGPIEVGDFIGIAAEGIVSVAGDLETATTRLLGALLDGGHELVTLIYGVDASDTATSSVTDWLSENYPEIEVEVHSGEQPLYHYYVGIE